MADTIGVLVIAGEVFDHRDDVTFLKGGDFRGRHLAIEERIFSERFGAATPVPGSHDVLRWSDDFGTALAPPFFGQRLAEFGCPMTIPCGSERNLVGKRSHAERRWARRSRKWPHGIAIRSIVGIESGNPEAV